MIDPKKIPQHVAIIMDGNGRWATKRGLPKMAGHIAGAKSIDDVIEAAHGCGVKVLTLYMFSTENWKRPRKEIEALFKLLEQKLTEKAAKLGEHNIRLMTTGRTDELPAAAQEILRKVIDMTRHNTGMILNFALNYGSRREIIEAVRAVTKDVLDGRTKVEDINEENFSGYLSTRGLPDPDLLIRTSGEHRISNFLLWQISYAEIYITEKLWPDFKKGDFLKAIEEYQRRERRFGG